LNKLNTNKSKKGFEKDFHEFLTGFARFFYPTFATIATILGFVFTIIGTVNLFKQNNQNEYLFAFIGIAVFLSGINILNITSTILKRK
jgi:cytochrome c biogenesis protein CcdA